MAELSVVVPTFNRADLLPAVVASIRAGGVDGVEIIVVDDGSTDGTADRIAGLGVRYIRQANAGPASARNAGAAVAQGKYIAFLDSDDRWRPGVAREIVDALDQHPTLGGIFTDAVIENGTVGSFLNWPDRPGIADLPAQSPKPGLRVFESRPLLQRLVERNFIFLGSVIVRREGFTEIGGFDTSFFGTEDWEFCLRLAARFELGCWHNPLAVYVRHGSNLSSDTDRMQADSCETLKKLRSDETPEFAELRPWIDRKLSQQLFDYAYLAYDRGDYREARERYRRHLETCGWHLKPFVLWTMCSLPAGWTRRLRNLRRWLKGTPELPVGSTS